MKSFLFLSPHVNIIDGEREFCVFNLENGNFFLVNKDAALLLQYFKDGNTLNSITSEYNINEKELTPFVDECINNQILLKEKIKKITNTDTQPGAFSLTLEVTNKCNLRCKHCYNNSGLKNNNETLQFATIKSIIDDIKCLYSNLGQLIITGGEPFLYKDIDKIILYSFNNGFNKIRINTNGTVFPENDTLLLSILQKYQDEISIQVSLLGATKETNDYLTSVNGSFEQTIKNLVTFKQILPDVSISFLISKLSIIEKDKANVISSDFEIPIVFNDNLLLVGRALDNKEQIYISPPKNNSLTCDGNYGNINYGKLKEEQYFEALSKFPPKLPCGYETISVSCNGDVLPCTLLQEIIVGNIYNNNISEIIKSNRMKKFQEEIDIDNRKICKSCEIRYFCSYKCPALTLGHGLNLGVKNPQCNYY